MSNSSNSSNDFSGNTKPKNPQVSPAKHWCFTFNNYTKEDIMSISKLDSSKVEVLVFQEENEGTPHLQGCLTFSTKGRPFNLNLSNKIHWEKKCPNSTLEQMRRYCCDTDKRIKDGYVYIRGYQPPKPLKILKEEQLRPWQAELEQLIKKEPDDREIIWVVGGKNKGKTQCLKYLCHKYKGDILSGSKRHDLSIVYKNQTCELFVMNLSADASNNQTSELFDIIECVKDGFFASAFGCKGTGAVFMNSPHLVIVSNKHPRWTMTDIDKERFNIIEIPE